MEIFGTMESLSMEDFDRQLNINVRSVLQLSKFAMPHLEKTKGNIIKRGSHVPGKLVPEIPVFCTSEPTRKEKPLLLLKKSVAGEIFAPL